MGISTQILNHRMYKPQRALRIYDPVLGVEFVLLLLQLLNKPCPKILTHRFDREQLFTFTKRFGSHPPVTFSQSTATMSAMQFRAKISAYIFLIRAAAISSVLVSDLLRITERFFLFGSFGNLNCSYGKLYTLPAALNTWTFKMKMVWETSSAIFFSSR